MSLPKDFDFSFSIAAIAEAEKHLGTKLGAIIAESMGEHGFALRTLRAVMAAGLPPIQYRRLRMVNRFAPQWYEEALPEADRLIRKYGYQHCAETIGAPLAGFLAKMA